MAFNYDNEYNRRRGDDTDPSGPSDRRHADRSPDHPSVAAYAGGCPFPMAPIPGAFLGPQPMMPPANYYGGLMSPHQPMGPQPMNFGGFYGRPMGQGQQFPQMYQPQRNPQMGGPMGYSPFERFQ